MRLQCIGKPQGQVLSAVRPSGVVQTPGTPSSGLQKRRTLDIPVSDLRVPGNESVRTKYVSQRLANLPFTLYHSRSQITFRNVTRSREIKKSASMISMADSA